MWNWFAQLALLGSLLGTFLVPSPATPNPAQELSATFFVAHVGGQEDASVVPITVVGGRPVTFEVRVRDAGTMQKAGWQIRLLLDACRFEIPAVQDILFGDYMTSGALIPVGPTSAQSGNIISLDLGQIALGDFTTASDGRLATITVTAKTRVACPDPDTVPPEQASAAFDLAILGAPGGVKYDVTALDGRFLVLTEDARKVFLPLIMVQ